MPVADEALPCVQLRDAGGASEWHWCAAHDERSHFEIRPCAGKGLAVFATRQFNVGDLILVEPALLRWWQDVDASREANLEAFVASVDALGDGAREDLYALMQAPIHGDQKNAFGIFLSNAFPCGEVSGDETRISSVDLVRASRTCCGAPLSVT